VTGATPVAEAVAAARDGALIVFPTDTVYGIAARADRPAATARLFEAKARPRGLTLPVLTASTAEARMVARFDPRADRLAAACWPGALTLVMPRTPRSRDWDLGGDPASIGVRVPAHRLALAVLAETGPLATTSANRSGAPPATTCDELIAAFGADVEVYLCMDEPLVGAASTVVSLLGPALEILRIGDLDPSTIERLSAG
jgi:tRNA threonylcarbamoyl adenosine modification protein (Sua5/YciO/YrdC/YwlC family)